MKLTRLHAIAISRLQFCTFPTHTWEHCESYKKPLPILRVVCGSAFFFGGWGRRNSNDSYFSWLFHDNEGAEGTMKKIIDFSCFFTRTFFFLSLGYCYADQFSISISLLELGHVRNRKTISKLWAISIFHLLKLYEKLFLYDFSLRDFHLSEFSLIFHNSKFTRNSFFCCVMFFTQLIISDTPPIMFAF